MIYLINKSNWSLRGIYNSYKAAIEAASKEKIPLCRYFITQDYQMDFVSRITFVDGECIYNNINFWPSKQAKDVLEHYEDHNVKDFLGEAVSKDRYALEYYSNNDRISRIDGREGRILYNINICKEFVALFREECCQAKFEGITPSEILIKLDAYHVTTGLNHGCNREVADALKIIPKDVFLTEERIERYSLMLKSSDAILYADMR